MLTADKNQFHEITAMEDCLMLDIFMPNYSFERSCTYYRREKLEGNRDKLLPTYTEVEFYDVNHNFA